MAGTKGRAAGRARAGQALPAFATGLNRPLPWKEVGLSATRGDSAAADKRAACRHVATSGSLVGFSPTVAASLRFFILLSHPCYPCYPWLDWSGALPEAVTHAAHGFDEIVVGTELAAQRLDVDVNGALQHD